MLVLLALALRAGAIAFTNETPRHDAPDYYRFALSIANGDGYPDSIYAPGGGPTAVRSPGYPAFLALVFKLLPGADFDAAQLAHLLLGVLTAVLIGLIAARLWHRRTGLVALGLAAVYPPLVLLPTAMLSENLYLPLQLGAVLLALGARGGEAAASPVALRRLPALRRAAAVGALVGLATLTRQNAWLLLLPLAFAFLPAGARRAGVPAIAVLAAATVVVVAPWTVRNAVVFDAFVPVANQSGVLLAGTYNDQARDDQDFPAVWRPPNQLPQHRSLFARVDLSEAALDGELRERALRYMRANPEYVPVVAFRNTLRLTQVGRVRVDQVTADDLNISLRAMRTARTAFHVAAVLALLGILLGGLRRTPRWVWLVPVVLWSSVLIAGLTRYRYPVDPFVLLLAAFALTGLSERVPRWR